MKKFYLLVAAALCTLGIQAAELTVADGSTTNENLPVYGFYADTGFKTQFIYPASDLADLEGSTINALLFYSAYASVEFPDGEVTVKLAEVEQTTLSEILDDASFQQVYKGSFDIANSQLSFEFSEPYAYEGGNLLVQVYLSTKSSKFPYTSFYGITSSGSAYIQTNIDVSRDFLPKVTFSYDEAAGTCSRPSKLAAAATPDGGVFTWEGEAAQYQWCIVDKGAEAAGWELLEAKTYTATSLTAGKEYDFYVRTYCDASSQSKETKKTFSPACNAPADVKVAELGAQYAVLSWSAAAGISKYQFACVRPDSIPEWSEIAAKEGLSVGIDTLQASTSYDFYIRSWFSDEVQSEEKKISFTTNCVAEELDWTEDFSGADLPNCWVIENKSSYGWSLYAYTDSYLDGYCMRFYSRSSTGVLNELQTPSIALTEAALLKFSMYNANGLTVKLYISEDGGSTRTELADLSAASSSRAEKEFDLSDYTGKNVLFFFEATSNSSSNYFWLDNMQVLAKPCVTPTNLQAAAASDGALITWTAGGKETMWNLQYRASGSEWSEIADITTPSYKLEVSDNTKEYEVRVMAVCGDAKYSDLTASVTFLPACGAISNVVVSEVSGEGALVSWDGAEKLFNVQYRIEDEEWQEVREIEGNKYQINGLNPLEWYEVRVQSACSGAEEFSDEVDFYTKCGIQTVELPIEEDFENVSADEGKLPDCWERRSATEYPQVTQNTGAYGADSDNKKNCIYFLGDNEQILILPEYDLDLREHSLLLFHKELSSQLEVGYLESLYGEFHLLEALSTLSSFGSQAVQVNLSEAPAKAFIAIRYTASQSYHSALVDNISLYRTEEVPLAIDTIHSDKEQSVKFMENGQLYLLYNGIKYNVQGQTVK